MREKIMKRFVIDYVVAATFRNLTMYEYMSILAECVMYILKPLDYTDNICTFRIIWSTV